MRLVEFNGGLNLRYTPAKLGNNQAVICDNVDYTADTIAPVKKPGTEAQSEVTGDVFYYFKEVMYSANNGFGMQPIFLENLRNLYRVYRESTEGTGVLQRLINAQWYNVGLLPKVSNRQLNNNGIIANPHNLFVGLPEVLVEDVTTSRSSESATIIVDYGILPGDTVDDVEAATISVPFTVTDSEWTSEIDTVYSSWLEPYDEALASFDKGGDVVRQFIHTFFYKMLKGRVSDHIRMTMTITASTKQTLYAFYEWEVQTQTPLVLVEANDSGVYKRIDYIDIYTMEYAVAGTPNAAFEATHSLVTTVNNDILGERIKTEKTTFKYVITLYSTLADLESKPVIFTTEIACYEWEQIVVSAALTELEDTYFDEIYIYRLGGAATEYTKVGSALMTANAPTFLLFTDDDLSDDAYTEGKLLDTTNVGAPPTDITHAVNIGSRTLLTSGNSLYMSELGNLDSFPVINTVEYNAEIIAAAESASGVLIFLDNNKTYLTMLINEGQFAKRLFSGNQSCKSTESLQYLKEHPIWVSNEGVCTVGATGVQVISKDILGLQNIDCIASIIYDEQYYILLADYTILRCDFRFNKITFNTLSGSYDGATSFLVMQDVLYIVLHKKLYPMFGTIDARYSYKTGIFDSGSLVIEKTISDIYLYRLDTKELRVMFLDTERTLLDNTYEDATESRLITLGLSSNDTTMLGSQIHLEGSSEVVEINYVEEGGNNDCC